MGINRSLQILNVKIQLGIVFLILIMLFSSYSNTFYSPPVLDDFHSFIDEPLVRVQSWSPESIVELAKTKFGWSRWIPMITFSLDLSIGRGSLFGLHLTSIIIHCLTFLSIFWMIMVLLRHVHEHCKSIEILPSPIQAAIWAASLWALNPVQTSTVTYLVQRMTSIVALFYVLSIAFYISGRYVTLKRGHLTAQAILLFIGSILALTMAFLSKQNSAMLPVMIVCTEAWFFQPKLFQHVSRFFRSHYFLLLAVGFIIAVVVSYQMPTILSSYSNRHFTITERLLTELRIVVWYMSVILWPHPGRLSLEHHIDLSTSLINPPSTFLSGALLFAAVYILISKRSKFPVITYGMLWFLLNMVIESTFISLELIFEHRMYLPSIGLVLCFIATIYHYAHRFTTKVPLNDFNVMCWCIVGVLASILSLSTFQRNSVWQDGVTLMRDSAIKHPESPRAHSNLSVALSRVGLHRESIQEANIAIEKGITNYEAYGVAANNIILSYMGLGEYEAAVIKGEDLLKKQPPVSDAMAIPFTYFNLGTAYLRLENYPKAFQATRQALWYNQQLVANYFPGLEKDVVKLWGSILKKSEARNIDLDQDGSTDPGDIPVMTWIAKHLLDIGYRKTALEFLEEAIKKYPTNIESNLLVRLMVEEHKLNQIQESKRDYTQKYVRKPFSPFNMCMALAFLSKNKNLPQVFMKVGEVFLYCALRIQPDSADAHLLKGWYEHEKKEAEKAVTSARRALDLDPDYAKAWQGLGFFLMNAGQSYDAIAAFRKSLDLHPGSPDRLLVQDIMASIRKDLANGANPHVSEGATAPSETSQTTLPPQSS